MTPRRPNTRLLAAALLAVAAATTVAGVAAPAAGGEPRGQDAPERAIVVATVDGVLDPVTAELVARTVTEAQREDAALVVLAVDSPGSLDVDVPALLGTVADSTVPVVGWVKAGGRARGAAALLVLTGHVSAMATDATLGPAIPVALDRGTFGRPLPLPADVPTEALRAEAAEGRELVEVVAPSLRDLVASLDGREVTLGEETVTLVLGEVVRGEGGEARKQVLPIRFRELGLADQAQHALTSPFVAYLLLVLGLCLIVFEFFAVGIGLAALAGALLVAAAFVGFVHLPVDWVSFGLLVAAFVAVSVDVQAGAARFWAAVGTVLLVVGSFRLYDGARVLDPPAWQVLLVVAGALVFLLPGLAAVVRARFSTPTIGREWMVGERGTADSDFGPDGVVVVRGAPWRARSTRAAVIARGDPVEITAVHGLVLEVQPVNGGEDSRVER